MIEGYAIRHDIVFTVLMKNGPQTSFNADVVSIKGFTLVLLPLTRGEDLAIHPFI
jgi:hypothetical protein